MTSTSSVTQPLPRTNPLKSLAGYGQSIWLDYIRRSLLTSGELDRLIDEDGLRGMTSNPAIFEKAILGSTDYSSQIAELEKRTDMAATALYEELALRDIREAADKMKRVYEETRGRDGYVSLEVSPYLARDTQATIREARRLWNALARPNVMIKVPATSEGIPAIQQLISEGININVTLLFALESYERVAEAFLRGLEARSARGEDVSRVASVASFFVSRIDAVVDNLLAAKLQTASPAAQGELKRLAGRVAIANARVAYARYKEIFSGQLWQALKAKGARTQRLLWASTGTKNPQYSDVLYVEELIGPHTVNTIPPATFDAFRDHGKLRASLEEDVEGARQTLASLETAGISLRDVTAKLLEDGVALFADAFDKLLASVDRTCKVFSKEKLDRLTYSLPAELAAEVGATLEDWRLTGKVRRLWARDATLWTARDENKWLGWLGITDDQLANISRLRELASEAQSEGFTHTVLLGMGGSSLCPEVLRMTFGKIAGFPELCVLDSTDPAQIRALESKIDLKKTLFIVSSKSGATLEPNIFKQYFFDRVRQAVGAQEAGRRFIAITDPGSKMQQAAEAEGFRHIFFGLPSIGGRYSALSNFGIVPAAVMGVDVEKLLSRAEEMVHACAACVRAEENPGVTLGVILGVLARHGRDKVTLIASPGIHDLGAWLEQLLAESTGKQGKGLIPVDREPVASTGGPPETYGNDRIFAYLRLESALDATQDAHVAALERAGQPVVRITVRDAYDIGQEFFRWEIATAAAGSIMGINPFDQPDVEASKVETRKLTAEYEASGKLREELPFYSDGSVRLFADEKNSSALNSAVGSGATLAAFLRAHFGRLKAGDYFALLAYVEMNAAHEEQLQAMRATVRSTKRVATCLGFGPRFLHSTGQAYKGGPNSGVFLQITCDDSADLPVPGQKYTFGVVKAAQARGDFAVLAQRGRRALRVHLGRNVAAGLKHLRAAVEEVLR